MTEELKDTHQIAAALTIKQCGKVIASYKHLQTEGSLGDCLLRQLAEGSRQVRELQNNVVFAMRDIVLEASMRLAQAFIYQHEADQPQVDNEEQNGIHFDVIERAYDFVVDIHGDVHGLTAGDMHYEPTGIALDKGSTASLAAISFQHRVTPWLYTCFSPEVASDKAQRTHRFVEEALELAQAVGCSKDEALQLVDYVYGREVGEIKQEVGGVMLTLAGLCSVLDVDSLRCGELELNRVWANMDKIREKQAKKDIDSPLPGKVEGVSA